MIITESVKRNVTNAKEWVLKRKAEKEVVLDREVFNALVKQGVVYRLNSLGYQIGDDRREAKVRRLLTPSESKMQKSLERLRRHGVVRTDSQGAWVPNLPPVNPQSPRPSS